MTDTYTYNKKIIEKYIQTKWAGKPVHFSDTIDSTNLWVQRLADEGAGHGTLCVAQYQSAGKGSRGRSWEAEKNSSIMMSLLLRPVFRPEDAARLTLVMGLSVAEAIREAGFDAKIKWPNDVVVSGKKICGILTQMRLDGERIRDVVAGVGINVNVSSFPEELEDKATSLLMESGKIYDRAPIIGRVMTWFEKFYEAYETAGDLSGMKEEYEAVLVNKDERVRILESEGSVEGTARGITKTGELIIEKDDGTMMMVKAGEVSVRGLYSYV